MIASPYFFGRERVRMGRGVDAILAAGLVDAVAGVQLGSDGGTVRWVEPQQEYRDDVGATFDLCSSIADAVAAAVDRAAVPLVLAGNCMATLGVLAGLRTNSLGVVWLDAHADFNTADSTLSGYVDGTALATVTGRCWKRVAARVDGFAPIADDRVVLVGARSLDEPEHELLAASGVHRVGATRDVSVDQRRSLDEAVDGLAERVRGVHLHVDLDVLDPDLVAPANEFAAPGGLTTLGVTEVIRRVTARIPVRSVTLACYDPAGDPGGRVAAAAVDIARSIRSAIASPPA